MTGDGLDDRGLDESLWLAMDRRGTACRLLAAGAHELKNPFATLQMGIDYLRKSAPGDDPEIPVVIQEMEAAVQRGSRLLGALVEFASARPGGRLVSADLNAVVDSALLLAEPERRLRKVRIDQCLDRGLPPMEGDPPALQQALLAVLLNAFDASGSAGGLVRVRTGTAPGMGFARVFAEVQDSGPGIPDAFAERVFQPFFTTGPPAERAGLGLTVARSIMNRHRGTIELRNRREGEDHGLTAAIVLRVSTDGEGGR
ncbi:MAG: HAMP domain-containing histidine kinase [Planctomycetes bacterium]|nr:HAMP domain-containing histidine kinase [Planctomycetota bacterium]